jgi:hypothetical protein
MSQPELMAVICPENRITVQNNPPLLRTVPNELGTITKNTY